MTKIGEDFKLKLLTKGFVNFWNNGGVTNYVPVPMELKVRTEWNKQNTSFFFSDADTCTIIQTFDDVEGYTRLYLDGDVMAAVIATYPPEFLRELADLSEYLRKKVKEGG